jgi:transcription elongation factor GreA
MAEQRYLTTDGAAKIKAELENLKGPERTALAERLRSAIQMGDLSENADYHKAKEDQAFLEGRILELEYLLKNAIIVEDHQGEREEVAIGARIEVLEVDYDEKIVYTLVGAKEADPRNGRISNESPIGSALMGHRVGDTITAQTPGGQVTLKILTIE